VELPANKPLVTMFIAVYNGEKYIKESIQSVLSQNMGNFELLILNDGSTDNTHSILTSFDDQRIRVITHEENKGLCESRKRGACEANGVFFAILDSDDISAPNRLEVQIETFEKQKDLILCGSTAEIIDSDGKKIGFISAPQGSRAYLKAKMLFANPFVNSSMMLPTSIFRDFQYHDGFEVSGDFDLFQRICTTLPATNLSENLVKYRVHGGNMSISQNIQKTVEQCKIVRRQLEKLKISYSEHEFEIHMSVVTGKKIENRTVPLKQYLRWFQRLYQHNKKQKEYSSKEFKRTLTEALLTARLICNSNFSSRASLITSCNWIRFDVLVHRLIRSFKTKYTD